MARVTVITDSTADVPAAVAQRAGLIVVPASYRVGSKFVADYMTARHHSAAQWLYPKSPLTVLPPSPIRLQELYTKLTASGRAVLSIHGPGRYGGGYESALIAKTALSGRGRIQVIEADMMSLGVGFIALAAAQVANSGGGLTEVAEMTREALLHAHLVFFVDEPLGKLNTPLLREPRLRPALVNGDKPLLSMEEGEVRIIDAVKSRGEVTETLYEFVELCPHIEAIAILHGADTMLAQTLVHRIEPIVPRERIFVAPYGPALAAQLGPRATGIAVYEGVGEIAALPQLAEACFD